MLTMTEKGRILRMWEAGHTSGEIAAALKITRSTVAGVLNRLREAGRIGYRQKPPKVKALKVPSKPKPKVEVKIVQLSIPLAPLPVPKKDAKKLPITQLSLRTCRYIVEGEGAVRSTFYCGNEVSRGAYCETHAAICYNGRDKILKPRTNDYPNRSAIALRYAQR